MSEAVMTALVEKGMNRQEAHELLRKLTIESELMKRRFKEILRSNKAIKKCLDEKEIDDALSPRKYLGTAVEQVERMIKRTRQERKTG